MGENGTLKGLPRGLAFRLLEAGGIIDRREVERDLAALSQAERRTLKEFGIRVGAHSVWLPGVLKARARVVAQAFAGPPIAQRRHGLSLLPEPAPGPRALSARGLRAVGRFAIPLETLERLAELKRESGKIEVSDAALTELGWTPAELKTVLAALRTPRVQKPDRPNKAPRPIKDSPFAALAALAAPRPPTKRRRPRKRPAAPT
mgnify:CR=1 FL=1